MCHRSCADSCPACHRGVHFGSSCRQWMHGVDARFGPSSGEEHWLCPDCLASFVEALRHGSVRAREPCEDGALAAHMCSLAASTHHGAGYARAVLRPFASRARQVRAHVINYLAGRLWISTRRVASLVGERFHRPRAAWCKLVLSQTVAALERQGMIWVSSDRQSLCIRVTGQDRPSLQRNRHAHRRARGRRRIRDELA